MTVELVAIIITGIISFFDLGVNCFQILMSGKTSCVCCGFRYKHQDTQTATVDAVRRASCPEVRRTNKTEETEETTEETITDDTVSVKKL